MNLVTGSTGLVGAHLVLELVRSGEVVKALRRPSSDMKYVRKVFLLNDRNGDQLFNRVEWVEGDILDAIRMSEVMRGIDRVYHCAACISYATGERDKLTSTNIMGTRNVVNAALEQRVRRFCHVSSVAALGVPPDMPYAADENYQGAGTDNTRYGCSKEGSEKEVMRGMAEGLNAFIVNPSVILGMACGAKGTTSLFRKLYRGILFYPNGSNGFVDVWDVVRAMIILMNSPISGERFILNGVNIRFQDLFREVSELFGKKAPRIRITRAMTEIAWRADWVISKVTGGKPLLPKETAMASLGNYSYSAGKICRMTGFKFTEFHQTLVRYATFYAQEFAAQSGRIKARENDFDLSNLFRMSFDGHGTLNTQH